MPTLPLNVFRKSSCCPTSQVLLDYRRDRLTSTEQRLIEAHLDHCDFCNAEIPLLDQCTTETEKVVLAEMPSDLRKLAEEVLRGTALGRFWPEIADYPQVSN